VLLLTVPVLRIASAVRGRQDVQMPLITTGTSYHVAADLIAATLRRHGTSRSRVSSRRGGRRRQPRSSTG
jgi:hypothetical protein